MMVSTYKMCKSSKAVALSHEGSLSAGTHPHKPGGGHFLSDSLDSAVQCSGLPHVSSARRIASYPKTAEKTVFQLARRSPLMPGAFPQ